MIDAWWYLLKRDPDEGRTADQRLIDAYEGEGLRGGDDGSGSKVGTMGTDAPLTFRQSFISLHGPEAWAAYQRKIKSVPPPTNLERRLNQADTKREGSQRHHQEKLGEFQAEGEWDQGVRIQPPPPDGGPPNIAGNHNTPDWVWEAPSLTRDRTPEELLNFPVGKVGVRSSD